MVTIVYHMVMLPPGSGFFGGRYLELLLPMRLNCLNFDYSQCFGDDVCCCSLG